MSDLLEVKMRVAGGPHCSGLGVRIGTKEAAHQVAVRRERRLVGVGCWEREISSLWYYQE